ncbi:Uncharacterised protein [Nocardia farcinica]|nr:Uncharacterised protein [Nocardia farcinica]
MAVSLTAVFDRLATGQAGFAVYQREAGLPARSSG